MRKESFTRKRLAGLLGVGACALLCLLAIGARMLYSQAAGNQPQTTAGTKAAQPDRAADAAASESENSDADGDDDGPSPGNFLGSTYVPSISTTDQPEVAAAPPPPAPVPADAGGDAARQQINNEMANLLALAYALKAEVDKTNQNQLSISVVRKAGQIEQMARKVRDEMRPLQQSRK